MTRYFTDRSRTEAYQRCPRLRFEQYHRGGMGIQSSKMNIYLAVGLSVHAGQAEMLRICAGNTEMLLNCADTNPWIREDVEEAAVKAALEDFRQYTIELDPQEIADQKQPAASKEDLAGLLAQSLGMTPGEAGLEDMVERLERSREDYDHYLAREQTALVEAMVRAYARRRLMPLLEQFEILEVEREGMWKLSDMSEGGGELWFMSRPDALLRERESNQLYILSFKTAGHWDDRQAKAAQCDMQGLSEGVEIDRRLERWWNEIHTDTGERTKAMWLICSEPMWKFLESQSAPPRVHAIRYEYLLKGERWIDKEQSAKFNMTVRTQRSHLIRGYFNSAVLGGMGWNWSWDFLKPDGSGEMSKLYYKNWKSEPVYDHMTVKQWIDCLDQATEVYSGEDPTVGLEPRLLGYKSPAQATGYTTTHPLDDVFIPPVVVYRNEDELRDWVEQVEAQERRVVEAAGVVAGAKDAGELRSLLNIHFPQARRACQYPTQCTMYGVCYGGDAMRADPVGSGKYKERVVNHPQELTR
jgi:hypothetical protein